MARTWVRGYGQYRQLLRRQSVPTATAMRYRPPSPEDPPAPELEELTEMVNRLLDEVANENPDPNRELAIVAFTDADGEDAPAAEYYLQLAWINVSVPSDPNYDEPTSSRSDNNH